MKKFMWMLIIMVGWQVHGSGQTQEVQQLLLNIEKLAQFKKIVSEMKKGYEILTKGYNTIKDISEGNFNLHNTFLNALWEVSPTVRKYQKIADIITLQIALTKKYKQAFNRFKQSGQFSIDEINYLSRVYGRLFDESIQHLDDLATVITAGKTRMSDQERLEAIDRIYAEMTDKLDFLNDFNGKTGLLAVARAKESSDIKAMHQLYQP